MRHILIAAAMATLSLTGCAEQEPAFEEPPVRGLLTTLISAQEATLLRRFPGVLEPTDITSLSFEVGGKLQEVDLAVGQRVNVDDVLAQLDPEQFRIEIENRKAAVAEAEALLAQDRDDVDRQQTLLERGAGTRLALDEARTDFRASTARLTQAQEALKSAEEDLDNTTLRAPFTGIINTVDAESFATVAVGAAITSIYDANAYEVSFSVNFDTVDTLVVGTPATIRLADNPATTLAAVVSEIGERADTVSSFPVVVELRDAAPAIRAGMAVEVALELPLVEGVKGYLLPVSAAINDGEIPEDAGPRAPSPLQVYVFDPETSTVVRRDVVMAGIRENKLLIIDGLTPGDRVARAGVAFLREGMRVNLLED